MNCEPGDLAFVIGAATPDLDGTLVEVLRFSFNGEVFEGTPSNVRNASDTPAWVCRAVSGRPLPWVTMQGTTNLCPERAIADRCLKPIRDTDKEDETLAWAGKPQGVKA